MCFNKQKHKKDLPGLTPGGLFSLKSDSLLALSPETMKFSITSYVLVLLAFLPLGMDFPPKMEALHCKILDASSMWLNGTTNVNAFSCTNEAQWSDRTIEFFPEDTSKRHISFRHASLNIPTLALECGNNGINDDLREALKASQYPEIKIDLRQATLIQADDIGPQWVTVQSEISLTICGVSRVVPMRVRMCEIQPHVYRLKGTQHLKMTDFGIEPPQAMLGLIKVRDAIQIDFDLFIDVTS